MREDCYRFMNYGLKHTEGEEFRILYYIIKTLLEDKPLTNNLLKEMSKFFGKTEKTIRRNIDRLIDKELLLKRQMNINGKSEVTYFPNIFILKNKKENKKKTLTRKELYREELKHPMWVKKRNVILKRDNHKCLLCGSENNLCVHHTKYITGNKAWEYPNSLLVTLCKDCHEKVHSNKKHKLYPVYMEK